MVTSASTFIITRCLPRSIAARPSSAPTAGTPVASITTSIRPHSRMSAASRATAVRPASMAASTAAAPAASVEWPSSRRAMRTASWARAASRSAMAATSTPAMRVARVTMSVPISPEPIRPMRTGRPVSARAARSRGEAGERYVRRHGRSSAGRVRDAERTCVRQGICSPRQVGQGASGVHRRGAGAGGRLGRTTEPVRLASSRRARCRSFRHSRLTHRRHVEHRVG